jgi:hypothetical protein
MPLTPTWPAPPVLSAPRPSAHHICANRNRTGTARATGARRPGRIDGPDTSARVARSKCNSPQDGTVCTLGHTVNRGRSRAFTLEHDPFAVGDWVSE